jgi:two-component system nitrate/nitrite response regulator NarL
MRILLIDDHTLFRIGLLELLERRGVEVIDAVGDHEIGMQLARDCAPDVVLLDLRMPEMHGLDILRYLRTMNHDLRVVILTTSTDDHDLIQAVQAGANGYLLKDMEPDDLINALREIVAGQLVIAPELTHVLVRALRQESLAPHQQSRFDNMTPREREILCQLAGGLSNKAIARQLGIADGTVKLHVKAILRKLAVRSRVEAAVLAVEHGLCSGSTMTDL